jgi:hypothetical protein
MVRMNENWFRTSAALALIGTGLMGCTKKSESTPVMQSILTAWQQGDQSAAIRRFVATDWSARPLFANGSTLSLSEAQFQALPAAEQDAKSKDIVAQTSVMRELAKAVVQAGRDAAGKNDVAQARKYFTSVKQYGAALDNPDSLKIVELVGRAIKQLAESELSKLNP